MTATTPLTAMRMAVPVAVQPLVPAPLALVSVSWVELRPMVPECSGWRVATARDVNCTSARALTQSSRVKAVVVVALSLLRVVVCLPTA